MTNTNTKATEQEIWNYASKAAAAAKAAEEQGWVAAAAKIRAEAAEECRRMRGGR